MVSYVPYSGEIYVWWFPLPERQLPATTRDPLMVRVRPRGG